MRFSTLVLLSALTLSATPLSGCMKPVFEDIGPPGLGDVRVGDVVVPEPTRASLESVLITPVVMEAEAGPEYKGDSMLMYAFPPFRSAGAGGMELPPLRIDGEVGDLLAGMAAIAAASRGKDPNGDLGGYVQARLPVHLVQASIQRFIGPDALQSVSVEKRAERDGTITWRGSLANMAMIEPVTLADRVVSGQFLEVSKRQRTYSLPYSLAPGQLQAYAEVYPALSKQIEDGILAADTARADFESRYRAAKAAYEDAGGKYDPDDKRTSGDEAETLRVETLKRIDAQRAAMRALEARYPAPDKLAASVAARVDAVPSEYWRVSLEARVIEARTQRTLWVGVLATEDFTAEAGMDRILRELVRRLATPAG